MAHAEKELNRRQLFKDLALFVGNTIADYAQKKVDHVMPKGDYLRPPGAVEEPEFLSLCSRCDECIKICPAKAIKRSGGLADIAIGTPVIIPKENPCVLCNGLLCITACKEGALKPVDGVDKVKIGIAKINQPHCLAWEGQDCQLCFIKCPLQGDAIYQEDGKPVINPEKCTGCGICEHVCNTINNTCAIKIAPKR
ncbi:MAG: 4Fe-4S dicluster domain-containing protein [Candidatus Loosdrechtia sp.]|uniref:4Fe-4S dicluster domain-containing protein n=1 Tax=Candidatus Loosdrechtia sp. TaxID=3101272 RepID=UPI003A5EDCCC|nr:MAG: 4Fe-4S dicluster domain-containing protein [Candidatus Jettenia sp. AMX2]